MLLRSAPWKIMFGIAVLILLVCQMTFGQVKLDTTSSGLPYKIFTKNTGSRIAINNIVTANILEKAESGAILVDTYASGAPVKIVIKRAQNITDLMDFLVLLTEKDSAIVKIPSDSMFYQYEAFRPSFIPKGSWVTLMIKIEKVQTFEEVMIEAIKDLENKRNAEKKLLHEYLKRKDIEPVYTASGLGYVVEKKTANEKPAPGDTVIINYTASKLDDVVFDTSLEEEARKVGLQQPGRNYEPISVVVGKREVIPGWDEGLLLMREGSKVRFFIPSKLAFDWEGSGDVIDPFTTLIIDVQLLKIKRAGKVEDKDKLPLKKL